MSGFDEHDEPEAARAPDLRILFVRGVVRSSVWVVLLILLGALIGLGLGLVQPNRYESHAKLSLRMGARERLTSESLVDFDERQGTPPPTMVDELLMLSDVAIFERVARELGPRVVLQPADPEREDGPKTPPYARFLHRLQAWAFRHLAEAGAHADDADPETAELRAATKALRDNSIVDNQPGSSVILVSYTASSPEQARTIVQALTNAFIERHREQFSIRALLEKSREQLEQARVARDAAAKAYVDQVSQSGITVLETKVPRLEAELSAAEGELFTARMRQEEIGRLKTSLSNRLQGIPTEVEIDKPAVMIPNDEYETHLTLKRALLAQRQQMLITSRASEETSRRVKEFDNQIALLDQKLAETPKVIQQGSEMQANLGHAQMEARILDLEVEEEALPVKIGLLEPRLESKKAALAEVQKQLLTASMMRKDLTQARDGAESRYAHLSERLSLLEALDSIDADEETNLRLLQAPTLELEKVGPERATLVLKGLLAGMLAALFFAVLRQRFDRRLRYPEVFAQARGVPVLGVVPQLSSLRRLRRRALAARS